MIYFKFNSQISGLDFTKIFNVFGGVLKFEKTLWAGKWWIACWWKPIYKAVIKWHEPPSRSYFCGGLNQAHLVWFEKNAPLQSNFMSHSASGDQITALPSHQWSYRGPRKLTDCRQQEGPSRFNSNSIGVKKMSLRQCAQKMMFPHHLTGASKRREFSVEWSQS